MIGRNNGLVMVIRPSHTLYAIIRVVHILLILRCKISMDFSMKTKHQIKLISKLVYAHLAQFQYICACYWLHLSSSLMMASLA